MRFRCSRTVGWAFLAIIAAALLVLVLVRREPLPSIPLADGSFLSVVAVEVGTNSVYPIEPRWRRYLRRACPSQWDVALLGKSPFAPVFRTKHDSLLIWLKHREVDEKPNGDRGDWARLLSSRVTGKPEKPVDADPVFFTSLGVACLEFRTYARDAKRLRLEMWNGTHVVPFEVINPRPTSAARWQAGPLPQTNRFSDCGIILRPVRMYGVHGADYFDPRFSVIRGGSERAVWVKWHMTAMDPWGNWAEARSGPQDSRLMLRVAGLDGDVWRIQANGVETLSAGFVPPLTNGAAVMIPLGAWAKESGVRFLLAVGAGVFQVQDGDVRALEETDKTARQAQLSVTTPTPGSWQVTILAPYPGVLCVTERPGQYKARLAGRFGGSELNLWTSQLWEGDGKRLKFHFFSPLLPATGREKFELEVFGGLPSVEYFIPSPQSPEWNATERNENPTSL